MRVILGQDRHISIKHIAQNLAGKKELKKIIIKERKIKLQIYNRIFSLKLLNLIILDDFTSSRPKSEGALKFFRDPNSQFVFLPLQWRMSMVIYL